MRTAATAETGLPPSRAAKQARLLSLAGLRGPQDGIPALASVSDATLDHWLVWMERYEKACGCKSGAALGLLTLIFWPLVGLRRLRERTAEGRGGLRGRAAALGAWAAAVVGGALVGKLGGLAVAAVARRSLIGRITADLDQGLPGQPEHHPDVAD